MIGELLAQRSVAALQAGLEPSAPPGPAPHALLRNLESIAPRLGVTRIVDHSHLLRASLPAFQSVRPRVYYDAPGQRSGSHGKHQRETIAKIACLMELVETVCGEPAPAQLIRATYTDLATAHVALDPSGLFRRPGVAPPRNDEALMWTPVLHWELGIEVLAPAELVYFPFACASYRTRSVFPVSSNGMAASGTLVRAALGGLYECVERMYLGLLDAGVASLEALDEEGLTSLDLARFAGDLHGHEPQLFAVTLPGNVNVPAVVALLVGDESVFIGAGCAADPQIAARKAVEEALLAFAYTSRDEAAGSGPQCAAAEVAPALGFGFDFGRVRFPETRTLTFEAMGRRHRAPRTDVEELHALTSAIHRLGYPSICFANLTRAGLDVPVVRAIVPGMPAEPTINRSTFGELTATKIVGRQFSVAPSRGSAHEACA